MPARQANILIADDEIFIREGLQEALQKPNYAVASVPDGNQARQLLAERDFHLVILDLRMPGPSGMELLEEIREQHVDTQCIILTAHGNVVTAVEAMRKGAYDFITKPVDLTHLFHQQNHLSR